MVPFSLSLGRWFGVPLRVHFSLVLVLSLAMGYSAVATGGLLRGIGLWLALLTAVAVREVARGVAAAYFELPLRALILLPVGGLLALSPAASEGVTPARLRVLAVVGSAANFLVALLLLGFAYGIDPRVRLLQQPWITVGHLLRSAVWLEVLVGFVNLLPTGSLPTRNLLRPRSATANAAGANPDPAAESAPTPRRTVPGLLTALALALTLSGLITTTLWIFLLGLTMLFFAYLNRASRNGTALAMSVSVRDVMLTAFLPLSASSTLRDALRQTTHTTQDIFPVLRGDRLVGSVSRSALVAKLQAEGDGYLQGAMQRQLEAVTPGEPLGDALRRARAAGVGEFIPVVENGAMLGMLTPGVLERAVSQLRFIEPAPAREDA